MRHLAEQTCIFLEVLEALAGSAHSLYWLAVVACSAACPVIHKLKSLILAAKETTALFQFAVAYSVVLK